MWSSISEQISRVAKELLGETKGRYISSTEHNRESWWWSDDVQKVINVKRESFKTWQKNKNEETRSPAFAGRHRRSGPAQGHHSGGFIDASKRS